MKFCFNISSTAKTASDTIFLSVAFCYLSSLREHTKTKTSTIFPQNRESQPAELCGLIDNKKYAC